MPRRRIRKLPPIGDPARLIFLVGHGNHAAKLRASAIREAARGKFFRTKAMKEAVAAISAEMSSAMNKITTEELAPVEKKEALELLKKGFRAFPFYAMEKKHEDVATSEIDRLIDFFPPDKTIGELDQMRNIYKDSFVDFLHKYEPMVNNLRTTVGLSIIYQRQLRAKKINVPLQMVYDAISLRVKAPLLTDLVEKGDLYDKTESAIIRQLKAARTAKLEQRADANREISSMRKKIGRFEISRAERKSLLSESRERIDSHATGISDWTVVRAFKRARLSLRERLQRLHLNPDTIFSELEIDKENEIGMKRLKVLTTVLRSAKTDEERIQLVERMVKKYRTNPQSHNQPLSETRFTRVAQPINPRKVESRRARAEARKNAETSPKPSNGAPKKVFPSTAGGFASLFGKEKRITGEMAIALNKFLQRVRPRQYPDAQIDQLMEHQILTIISTQFQKSGRVSETGLRELTTAPLLIENFKRALRSLIKKNYLEYEAHAGRSDYVSIKESAANKILGKYNTKIARLHENDG